MALKFSCENCGENIAVRFLEIGEAAECKSCGASNSVPESAESISDEAAERMIKAPVSQPAKAIRAEVMSQAPAPQSVPIAKALRIVARILVGVGVIVGIVGAIRVLIQHPAPNQTMAVAISMVGTWLITMFLFCILSVLCLGIAKGVELLSR